MQDEKYITTRETLSKDLPTGLVVFICDILDRCYWRGYSDQQTGFFSSKAIISITIIAWDFAGQEEPSHGEMEIIKAIYNSLNMPQKGDLKREPEI